MAASTGTFYGQAMTADHIYTVAGNGKAGFSRDGGPATAAELSSFTVAVAVDGAGDLAIYDANNYRIRMVAAKSGTFYRQADDRRRTSTPSRATAPRAPRGTAAQATVSPDRAAT